METSKNELILNDLYFNQLTIQNKIEKLKKEKINFLIKKDNLNFLKAKEELKILEAEEEILNDKIFKILDNDKEMNNLYQSFKKEFNF